LTTTGTSGRPEDAVNADALNKLYEWLESSCENRLYTLEDLQQHMLNYVEAISDTLTENVYTTKYLKKKLQARYGDNVYFAELNGRKNVTCFRNLCSFIISDKWYDERNKDLKKRASAL